MDLVADCLRIRHWVVSLLSRRVAATTSIDSAPTVSARAWQFFLAAESCARPLSTMLGGEIERLSPTACNAIRSAARDELQRIMSASAQLAEINRMAQRCGLYPVVLKGGVHAIDGGSAFDLCDVDLMLGRDAVQQLGRAMTGQGDYVYNDAHDQFSQPLGITVELHAELHVGHGVDAIAGTELVGVAGYSHLRRLSPPQHLVYCIQHSTTRHPFRRGHLRDALLIADAMDDCTEDEIEQVMTLLTASASGSVYVEAMCFADSMRVRPSMNTHAVDPFRRTAAGKYAVALCFPGGSMSSIPLQFDHVAQFLASPTEWAPLVRGYLAANYQSSRGHSVTLARYSARLAKLLGLAARTPYRIVVLSNALVFGLSVRALYAMRWRRIA